MSGMRKIKYSSNDCMSKTNAAAMTANEVCSIVAVKTFDLLLQRPGSLAINFWQVFCEIFFSMKYLLYFFVSVIAIIWKHGFQK